MKKISVALASYNSSKYILEQLSSIVDQTKQPDEIIISDDNSTDDTVQICNQYLSKANIKYRIISNKYTPGFASNFNSALEECSGDIIFLSDQDDFWHPNKIKSFLEYANGQFYLIMCDMSVSDSNLKIIDKSILKARNIEKSEYNYGCSMAISRNLLDIALPIPYNIISHDIWISFISEFISSKIIINKPLQIYRRHDKNVTTNLAKEKESLISKIFNLRQFRSNLNKQNAFYNALLQRKNIFANHNALNTSFIERLNENILVNKIRLSGNTKSRLITPFSYYNLYRSKNISVARLIKDSIVLNNYIQK